MLRALPQQRVGRASNAAAFAASPRGVSCGRGEMRATRSRRNKRRVVNRRYLRVALMARAASRHAVVMRGCGVAARVVCAYPPRSGNAGGVCAAAGEEIR